MPLHHNQITQIDAPSAKTELEGPAKPFLLDVREPGEYRDGHISSAVLIPLGELVSRADELPRDREIICVCHSGNRSSVATRWLNSLGISARNLIGGMVDWERRGLPVKKGMTES